jgi:hypothetical protein
VIGHPRANEHEATITMKRARVVIKAGSLLRLGLIADYRHAVNLMRCERLRRAAAWHPARPNFPMTTRAVDWTRVITPP